MKKFNLFKSSVIFLSFLFIAFLSVSFLYSCRKDSDMKDSSMKDSSMKNKSADDMGKKTDTDMNTMLDKKMSNMMDKMNKVKMTGNTDVDFVNMMIIHHQGAIDMAVSEHATGKHENIRAMSDKVIQDQQKEIETMQSWLEKNKDKKSTSGDNSNKLMESMKSMMNPDMKMTGNTDQDYVSMMILHHMGAIDMAGVEIKYGTDPEIKKMAQEIIKNQKTEIEEMKLWQNSKNK